MNQPLSRYAGGKRHLLPQILGLVPKEIKSLYEPYAGGAALFWSLTSPETPLPAVLVDTNPFVSGLYQELKQDAAAVAECMKALPRETPTHEATERAYNGVRESLLEGPAPMTAARVLWLNRRCFNGLMRVNKQGEFNVPVGKWAKSPPPLPTRQEILDWGAALQSAEILSRNCTSLKAEVCYMDPPYWGGFTQYTREGFSWTDQVMTSLAALAAADQGSHVVVSNSDTPEIRALYAGLGFRMHEVSRAGNINSDGTKRERVGELLMVKEAL